MHLLRFTGMQSEASPRKPRRNPYRKTLDSRKHRVRGVWDLKGFFLVATPRIDYGLGNPRNPKLLLITEEHTIGKTGMNYINYLFGAGLALSWLLAGAGLAQAQPALRVDPQTLVFDSVGNRTIYVELDWMEAEDHSHKPSPEVLDRIVRTFAAEGYSIVIELGNAIPHQDNLDVTGSPSGSPDIQAIRNEHFAHRFDPRYFYSIWAHRYNDGGSSGVADLPGRVHLVTLGAFPGQVGTFNHQVGTFVHEFGHNLGQRHGGEDHSNYKPNYVSVMNYHFQLSGIGPVLQALGLANGSQGFNDFGYSHGALPPLNELNLDERVGIGLGRAVDWNCDGDATDFSFARDLQENGNWCSPGTSLSVISDFDNWTSINDFISAGGISAASLEAVPAEPSETCIDWEQHQAMLRELGPLAEPSPPPSAGMEATGVDPGPGFMIHNDGQASLVVSAINKVTPADWIGWTPQPPFVIPPGSSRLVVVTVDFTRAPVGASTNELSFVSNDPDGSTNVSVVVVNQASTANLYVRQRETADPASTTCPLTYTLEIGNQGPTGATGVFVTNELPAGVTFDSATSSQGTVTRNGSIVVADLGTIQFSSNATVRITVIPTTTASLTNRAQVTSAQTDPDPGDNIAIETTTAFVDNTGPGLLTAAVGSDGHSVTLTFSEPVSATAFNLNHYALTDGATNRVPIEGVQPGSSPSRVVLQANLLTRVGPFAVRVTNITDCIGNVTPANASEIYVSLTPFTFVNAGSSWKYLDNGSDQGTAWRALTFDDSGWPSGLAQLGYGDGDEITVVSYGGNAAAKFITTYFRKSFVLEDASKLTNAVIYLLRDDGAAVYLNGTQVVRSNLAANATSTTLASINEQDADIFFASRINSALLRTGTNVLAVEVHQSSETSSDVSFDLALTAEVRIAAVRPAFIQHPETVMALVGDTVSFSVEATGTPPLYYRWRFNNLFITPSQAQMPTLTLTNVQLTNAGTYTVVVTNSANVGGVLSGRGTLSVMTDEDGDRMGDAWEDLHGFDDGDPSDASGDADGDGMNNREEFIAGTHPRDSGSFLMIDSIAALTNSIRLGFTAVSNRSYSVLYREQPASAPWQRLTNTPGRTTNRIETILDAHGTNRHRWYRLVTPKEP
jgi:uncharacterized repeat protein (TIGR01451 family)